MTRTQTWKPLPKYSTNLDFIPYGNNPFNTKIFIRVNDVDLDVSNNCGDPEPNEDEKKELEADVIGTVFEFDLFEEVSELNTAEYDSEFHFVRKMIDQKIADSISNECGWLVNYVDFEEVDEEN